MVRRKAEQVFDRVESLWTSDITRKGIAQILLLLFVVALIGVEVRRRGWLGDLGLGLPETHFVAVKWVVDLLLLFEIVDLVFSLSASVAGSLGKQLQIFALILIRKSFDELRSFPEPINLSELPVAWTFHPEILPLWNMAADAVGAFAVFLALVVYERMQHHRRIMKTEAEEARFIQAKKLVALVLVCAVVYLVGREVVEVVTRGANFEPYAPIFTVFIFSDIAIVLISLRYTDEFRVVFRNFGFAVATVFMRLGITASPGERAAMAVAVGAYAVGLAWAYNLAAGADGEGEEGSVGHPVLGGTLDEAEGRPPEALPLHDGGPPDSAA
jgi:hypothetical protein